MSTRAPFESFHSVTPTDAICLDDTIVPGAGGVGTSGALDTESVYAATVTCAALSSTARSVSSLGNLDAAFCGALTTITRLRLPSHFVASSFTSLTWIPG